MTGGQQSRRRYIEQQLTNDDGTISFLDLISAAILFNWIRSVSVQHASQKIQ